MIRLYLTIYRAEIKVLYVSKSWRQKSEHCLYLCLNVSYGPQVNKDYFPKYFYVGRVA